MDAEVDRVPWFSNCLCQRAPFLLADAALAGLRVLSVVDQRIAACLRWDGRVEVVFAVPLDRMPRSDLIPRSVPAGRISGTGLGPGSESSSSACRSSVAEWLVRLPHGVEDDG